MIKKSQEGAVTVLAIEGALNEEEAGLLRDGVEALPQLGRPQIVIDLAEVPLIDSSGCEALLDIRDAVTADGGAAHLSGVSPLCNDILYATGVLKFFRVFDAKNQAVAQFAH